MKNLFSFLGGAVLGSGITYLASKPTPTLSRSEQLIALLSIIPLEKRNDTVTRIAYLTDSQFLTVYKMITQGASKEQVNAMPDTPERAVLVNILNL